MNRNTLSLFVVAWLAYGTSGRAQMSGGILNSPVKRHESHAIPEPVVTPPPPPVFTAAQVPDPSVAAEAIGRAIADRLADRLDQRDEQTRQALAQLQDTVAQMAGAMAQVNQRQAVTPTAVAPGGNPAPTRSVPATAPSPPAPPRSRGRFAGQDDSGKWWYHDDPEEVKYAVTYYNRRLRGIPLGQGLTRTASQVVETTVSTPVVAAPVTTYAAPVTYAAPAYAAPVYSAMPAMSYGMAGGGCGPGGCGVSSGFGGGPMFGGGFLGSMFGGCAGGGCR